MKRIDHLGHMVEYPEKAQEAPQETAKPAPLDQAISVLADPVKRHVATETVAYPMNDARPIEGEQIESARKRLLAATYATDMTAIMAATPNAKKVTVKTAAKAPEKKPAPKGKKK